MKLLINFSLLCFLISMFLSCKKTVHYDKGKNEIFNTKNEHDTIKYKFFLNDLEISRLDFDIFSGQYKNIAYGYIDSLSNEKNIYLYVYTSDEMYVNRGKIYGVNLQNLNQFEEKVHEYIENNPNVLSLYDENEQLDEKFERFQDSIALLYFGHRPKAPSVIHDKVTGGSPAWTMLLTINPVMPIGWNDRVSSINNLNIFSFMHLYDKTFFRNRMISFIGFHGWQLIPFNGPLKPLDNNISSIIH